MTWLLRVLFVLLPVVGWAEGTRVDERSKVADIVLEVTLSPGLGLSSPEAYITFENRFGERRPENRIKLTAGRAIGQHASNTYRFAVADSEKAGAMAIYDRTGAGADYGPGLHLCTTPAVGRSEVISYRLYRPGFGNTPVQQMGPATMRPLIARMDPCPTDPTAR